MEHAEFVSLCTSCYGYLRSVTPYDKGNLKYNALQVRWEDQDTCCIYIDDSVAPYMPYTNEPWVAKRWKGAQNPNQYWFDKAAQKVYGSVEHATGVSGKRTDKKEKLDIDALSQEYRVAKKHVRINSTYQVNQYGIFDNWYINRKGKTP